MEMSRGAGPLAVLLVVLAGSPAVAADAMTLKEGSWVCGSPEAYRQASTAGWQGPQFSLQKFRSRQQEQEACLYVDDDLLEDMMAPFVSVLENDGPLAKVSFVVEYYQRVQFLHRRFSRIQFTGWTDTANVEPRVP